MSKRSVEIAHKIAETLSRPDPRHAPTNNAAFNLDRSQQIGVMARSYGGKALNFQHGSLSTLNQDQMPATSSPSYVHIQFPHAEMTRVRSFVDVLKAQGYSVSGSADSDAYHLLVTGKGGVHEAADAVVPLETPAAKPRVSVSGIRALEVIATSNGMAKTAQALRLAASQAGLEGAIA